MSTLSNAVHEAGHLGSEAIHSFAPLAHVAIDVAESFTRFPNAEFTPLGVPAALLAAALLKRREVRQFDQITDSGIAHYVSNPAAIRRASQDVATGESRNERILHDRQYRFGSRWMMAGGLALLAGSAIQGPNTTTTSPDTNSNTVVVVDDSYAMTLTKDMGGNQTRFQAVVQGLSESDPAGNVGVIEFGVPAVPVVALGKTTPQAWAKLTPEAINTNPVEYPNPQDGADLGQAMSQAAGMLPDHKGNEIIISDGVGESTAEVKAEQQALAKQFGNGIHYQVILTGTSGNHANYIYNGGSPETSAVQPEVFSGFSHVAPATNGSSVASAIKTAVETAGTKKHRKLWYPPLVAGAVIAAIGYRRDGKQRVSKEV